MNRNDSIGATVYNERFAKIAGVLPQKRHHELATASPAGNSVRPATSASRWSVVYNGKTRQWQQERNNSLLNMENYFYTMLYGVYTRVFCAIFTETVLYTHSYFMPKSFQHKNIKAKCLVPLQNELGQIQPLQFVFPLQRWRCCEHLISREVGNRSYFVSMRMIYSTKMAFLLGTRK